MRFRLAKSSNRNGMNYQEERPSDPYLPGAEVVKRFDYAYPEAVQYIEINTLEQLMEIAAKTDLVIRKNECNCEWDSDIENVPVLEIYDAYRE